MKKVKLMMVGAMLTMMGATTASAQVTSIDQLEGIYNMTWNGYTSPDGFPTGLSGEATVELRAIDGTNEVTMTGFYMDGCVATASVDLTTMKVTIPSQQVLGELMTCYDNQSYKFDAIGTGAFDWDWEMTLPNNQPLTGTIDENRRISLNELMLAFRWGHPEFGSRAYQQVALQYVEPLPMTGVKNVDAEAAVVAERWYTIDGRETMRPATSDGHLYIVVRQMQDGTLRSSKVRN